VLPLGVLASDGNSGGGNAGGNSGGGNAGGNSGGGNAGGNSGGGNAGGNSGGGNAGGNSGGGNAGGRGAGRSVDEQAPTNGWGSTPSSLAREAVAQGRALPLSTVLPTVSKAVAGQVLEVDLRQIGSGVWHYEVLVLTRDRRYQVVVVDAQRNQIVQLRSR
jgi:hypothetical protein